MDDIDPQSHIPEQFQRLCEAMAELSLFPTAMLRTDLERIHEHGLVHGVELRLRVPARGVKTIELVGFGGSTTVQSERLKGLLKRAAECQDGEVLERLWSELDRRLGRSKGIVQVARERVAGLEDHITGLEGQVRELLTKLDESKRSCRGLQRRLAERTGYASKLENELDQGINPTNTITIGTSGMASPTDYETDTDARLFRVLEGG